MYGSLYQPSYVYLGISSSLRKDRRKDKKIDSQGQGKQCMPCRSASWQFYQVLSLPYVDQRTVSMKTPIFLSAYISPFHCKIDNQLDSNIFNFMTSKKESRHLKFMWAYCIIGKERFIWKRDVPFGHQTFSEDSKWITLQF